MDLIDRKPVIDFLNEQQAVFTNEYLRKLINMQIYIINGMPAVDAEPVRHGEWNTPYDAFHDMITIVCSLCGHTGAKHFKYCPNCGARMDGE